MTSHHANNYYWEYDPQYFSDINADYFCSNYWANANAIIGKEHGRGTTWFIKHGAHELVLRHYLRGGVISKINRESYLFTRLNSCRSISEFKVLEQLHALKLPVPKPIAAQVIRGKLSYRADLIIERIPNARDLLQVLQSNQESAFYIELANMIAQFHQHGVYHADLNIQNILFDAQGKFWLIDFDRATISPDTNKRNTNKQARSIKRLKRSFEKEKGRHGIQWSEQNWLTFYQAYSSAIKQ